MQWRGINPSDVEAPVQPVGSSKLAIAEKTDASAVFNYGLDKVRFVTPVRCGDRVRLQLALASVEPKDDGQFLIKGKATLGD